MVPSPCRLAAVVGCVVSLPAAAAAQAEAAGLGAVVRQLVVESLTGGGRRADQVLVAADSGSAALLGLAGISAAAAGPAGLVCPGSTEAAGRPAPTPVGYVVRVTFAAAADTAAREVHVGKSCEFRYRGRGHGFRETGTWELRRRGGGWYVARMLESSIT